MCEIIFSLEVSPEVDKRCVHFLSATLLHFAISVTDLPDWAAGSSSPDQASVATAAVGAAGRALEMK